MHLGRGNMRILEIDLTTDNSDNDIESIDTVQFFRDAQSRTAGNGFSVPFLAAASEGAAGSVAGTSLGSSEVWIYFSQQLPRVGVLVLDQATQG